MMLLREWKWGIGVVTALLITAALSHACQDTGTDSNGEDATTAPPVPSIDSISPTEGPPGITVTIDGSGFSSTISENKVTFSGTLADVTSATTKTIEATVPDQATSGAVEVVVNGRTAVGPNFTVEEQMPGITGIKPDSGMVGTQVTITGMNFSSSLNDIIVTFNGGVIAEVQYVSQTELDTAVPEGAQSGPIIFEVDGQEAKSPSFTVIPARKIAFVSDRNFNPEIWVIRANGTNATNLASDTENDSNPRWSPDGTQIAFVSNRTGNFEIWLMEADGSHLTKLTDDPDADGNPLWSPDGTMIMFESNRSGNRDIWVMGDGGLNETNLTNDSALDDNPRWSPDGTQITFVSDRTGDTEIWVMGADGPNLIAGNRSPERMRFFSRWRPN